MFSPLFSFTEILSLLGLVQSVYVLVYMIFRSGNWKYAILPIGFFALLGLAFLSDAAATRWDEYVTDYNLIQWIFWFSCVPLGTLLVFQVARTPDLPPFRYCFIMLLIPLSLVPHFIERQDNDGLVYVGGLVAGALSLLTIWIRRDILGSLTSNPKMGGERFWLILSLIVTQVAFLASTFAYLNEWLTQPQWVLVRNALGIALAYIAATSLLRIYPQALKMDGKVLSASLTDAEMEIIHKLEALLLRDKIYQEPDLGRTELARELGIGEANLSRLVNLHYGKTIPQMLNDYRVQDAQRLLRETDVSVNLVFMESGFRSITTFNRVFKELAGVSPTEYRAQGHP